MRNFVILVDRVRERVRIFVARHAPILANRKTVTGLTHDHIDPNDIERDISGPVDRFLVLRKSRIGKTFQRSVDPERLTAVSAPARATVGLGFRKSPHED